LGAQSKEFVEEGAERAQDDDLVALEPSRAVRRIAHLQPSLLLTAVGEVDLVEHG